MKTLAAIILTLTVVGCTSTHGRSDRGAKAQRIDRQHHRHLMDSSLASKEFNRCIESAKKIDMDLENGKITREEARKKRKALRAGWDSFLETQKKGSKNRGRSKNRQ